MPALGAACPSQFSHCPHPSNRWAEGFTDRPGGAHSGRKSGAAQVWEVRCPLKFKVWPVVRRIVQTLQADADINSIYCSYISPDDSYNPERSFVAHQSI